MQDLATMLAAIRRPKLLVTAARIAAADYRRDRNLPVILGRTPHGHSGTIIIEIMELEAELNAMRKEKRAGYSPTRHVNILASLIAESRPETA